MSRVTVSSLLRLIGVLSTLLFISACVTPGGGLRADRDGPARSVPNDWRLFGRVSVETADDVWHARLDWQQHASGEFQLRIIAPLGQGTFQVSGETGRVTLVDNENRRYSAADAEQLVFERVGWRLPLQGLRHWVVGEPGPAPGAQQSRNAASELEVLRQDGWKIVYSGYRAMGAVTLPTRLDLSRDELNIVLRISRWTLP